MADIVFRYEEMRNAASQMDDIAARYKAASEKFQQAYLDATSSWEGATKDAMEKFITIAVGEYMGTTVPGVVTALAELLRANADQMQNADQQIAENVPQSLG